VPTNHPPLTDAELDALEEAARRARRETEGHRWRTDCTDVVIDDYPDAPRGYRTCSTVCDARTVDVSAYIVAAQPHTIERLLAEVRAARASAARREAEVTRR
jgi:hypothetical protein